MFESQENLPPKSPENQLKAERVDHVRPVSPTVTVTSDNKHEEDMEAAWIPTSASREVFLTVTNTSGSFFPTREQMTLPGVSAGSHRSGVIDIGHSSEPDLRHPGRITGAPRTHGGVHECGRDGNESS